MTKISRAKSVEVHKLQSEYKQFYTQCPKGILLATSYTDEMQALKDMMKTKDAEQKRKESECANDKLISLALCGTAHYSLAHPTLTSTNTLPTSATLHVYVYIHITYICLHTYICYICYMFTYKHICICLHTYNSAWISLHTCTYQTIISCNVFNH